MVCFLPQKGKVKSRSSEKGTLTVIYSLGPTDMFGKIFIVEVAATRRTNRLGLNVATPNF